MYYHMKLLAGLYKHRPIIMSPVHKNITLTYILIRARDSSVGTAIRYGLDGQDIESRWGRDFLHTSRPGLGPTQPPIQWVPGLSQG
jgi:hypothetical protein